MNSRVFLLKMGCSFANDDLTMNFSDEKKTVRSVTDRVPSVFDDLVLFLSFLLSIL